MRHSQNNLDNPESPKSSGHRLFTIRNDARLTQAQFAHSIGVSPAACNAYEKGKRSLPAKAMILIGETYGVDINWLLRGSGVKYFGGDVDLVDEFFTRLVLHIEERNISIRAERVGAVISRWTNELKRGRVVEFEHVAIRVDLLKD